MCLHEEKAMVSTTTMFSAKENQQLNRLRGLVTLKRNASVSPLGACLGQVQLFQSETLILKSKMGSSEGLRGS